MSSQKTFAKHRIDHLIHRIHYRLYGQAGAHQKFMHLVTYIRMNTHLLHIRQQRLVTWDQEKLILHGLENLARFGGYYLRRLETWLPVGKTKRAVFQSLVDHLLGRFPMSQFLYHVWYDSDCYQWQHWFIKLARGASVKSLKLPYQLTKKMAHQFTASADHLSVQQAIRVAQVKGFGGSKALADAVCNTLLLTTDKRDAFWQTVIQFMARVDIDVALVKPIIELIDKLKFREEHVTVNGQVLNVVPPMPNFSMKSRTVSSMVQLLKEWRCQWNVNKPVVHWQGAGISNFQSAEKSVVTGELVTWRVTELLDSHQLYLEGKRMSHCVADYWGSCKYGATSIWSLTREYQYREKSKLTIEVNVNDKAIMQVKARFNANPDKKSLSIMSAWAESNGIEYLSG